MKRSRKKLYEYEFSFRLESGAHVEIRQFSHSEHMWIFGYLYREAEKRLEVKFVNKIKLTVEYMDGISEKCVLSMDMAFPENLGKEYSYGVDVSKGGKLSVQFVYRKETREDKVRYKMERVEVGAFKVLELKEENALVKQMQFPFPLKDVMELDMGRFEVPFLDNKGEERFFRFPDNIRRISFTNMFR